MKRALCCVLACGVVAVASTAHADVGDSDYNHVISGGLITGPVGLYNRYDYSTPVGDDGLRLGGYANWLVYSAEVGANVSYRTNPAWLEAHLDLGGDPGFFLHGSDDQRKFDWRAVARGQTNLNLQFAYVWFYSRTTGLFRYRNFEERDTFQGFRLEREWSIEQATAMFFRVAGTPVVITTPNPASPALWVYGEYTVGRIKDAGTFPNRVSAGLVTERVLSRNIVFNLDLYWSFSDSYEGPGAIFLYWYYF